MDLLQGNRATPTTEEYSIREITALNDFRSLRTVWDSLAKNQEAYLPFLCFDWFKLWLEHFRKDNKFRILLLNRKDETVAIAPLLIKKEKFKGIKIRKIELIGNVYSPIRYFLFSGINDEERERHLSLVFSFLRGFKDEWDIIELNAIPEENNCFCVLQKAVAGIGLKYSDYSCFGDWYLDGIDMSWDQYFNKFNSKFRHNIKYRREKLQKAGELRVEIINNRSEGIDQYMDRYYDVYSKSWQQKEIIGPTFHRELARMAAEKGWLRLGFLLLDDSPISSQLWISCNGNAFSLKTVYDQAYKQYSPGQILTAEMMKYAIDIDKVKTMDYLHGDEAYKKDWTPKRRERKGILIYNNSIKGQSLGLLNMRILPTLNKNRFLKRIKEIVVKRLG